MKYLHLFLRLLFYSDLFLLDTDVNGFKKKKKKRSKVAEDQELTFRN